eukprot:1828904-Prymnesium_polylepis.1
MSTQMSQIVVLQAGDTPVNAEISRELLKKWEHEAAEKYPAGCCFGWGFDSCCEYYLRDNSKCCSEPCGCICCWMLCPCCPICCMEDDGRAMSSRYCVPYPIAGVTRGVTAVLCNFPCVSQVEMYNLMRAAVRNVSPTRGATPPVCEVRARPTGGGGGGVQLGGGARGGEGGVQLGGGARGGEGEGESCH